MCPCLVVGHGNRGDSTDSGDTSHCVADDDSITIRGVGRRPRDSDTPATHGDTTKTEVLCTGSGHCT